jgi:hypothetical protein
MAPGIDWPKDIKQYVELPYTTLKDAGKGIADIGTGGLISPSGAEDDFLGRIVSKTLWVRVAEFAVGGILFYVGLRALFPSQITLPLPKVG